MDSSELIYEFNIFRFQTLFSLILPTLAVIVFAIIIYISFVKDKENRNWKYASISYVVLLLFSTALIKNWIDHLTVYYKINKNYYVNVVGEISKIKADQILIVEMVIGGERFYFDRQRFHCLKPRLVDDHPFQFGKKLSVDYIVFDDYRCIVKVSVIS